jgi:hypothetical protein
MLLSHGSYRMRKSRPFRFYLWSQQCPVNGEMMRLQGGQTVILLKEANAMFLLQIEPLIAAAVVVATAC